MKNLRVNEVNVFQEEAFKGCESFVECGVSPVVYVARAEELIAWNTENKAAEWRLNWSAEREGASLVDLQLLYDSAELAAALSDGSLLLVNTESLEITKECVGCECSAAAWSPDLTCIAVSDGVAVTFYDRMLECIQSCELRTVERGKDEQVTVGWGSKETQFQGSAGKAAREKKEESREAYPDDSGKDHIRWRGDGEFVVVSHLDESVGERRALIFDKNGELMSRLKIERSMEESVAVKTVGNYIATTSRDSEGKRQIVFFERNGEKRHEYCLPTTAEEKVLAMAWDLSGTTLMMHYRGADCDRLEMWTVSNYDWNRKWSHVFKSRISHCKWDTEKAQVFLLVTEDGSFIRLSFSHAYSAQGTIGCVVATDGFRITNFSRAPVPPPMCEYVLPSAAPLCFSFNGRLLAVIDAQNTLHMYEIGSKGRLELASKAEVAVPVDWLILSMAAVFEGFLLVVVNGSRIVRIDTHSGEIREIESPGSIISLSTGYRHPVAVTSDGVFHQLAGSWEEIYRIPATPSVDVKCTNENILVLSSTNELFLNGQSVANSVGSFLIAVEVCIYVTLQNKIIFANCADGFKKMDAERAVELGSQVVCCVPEKMSVALQMPRGNLETIYPRIFVVQVVRGQIDSLKYVDALNSMKKHRVNMNLLVDHDFEKFVDNVSLLFAENSTAEIVNLLIASLSSEMSEWCSGKAADNKVEKVTSLLQEEVLRLETASRLKFFTVLLSSLLKHSPPRVEEALKFIKRHTDEMDPSERDAFSRHWLHHVGFFVDEKSMFNAALATYDLHLTVQVAEASNRDPKEYLPLLNELRKVNPEHYRRYRIQLVREDWPAAVEELAQVEEKFDEAESLIKHKNLYSHALRIFKGKEKYTEVCGLVAAHLELKGQWAEAAILYSKAGNVEKTLLCLEKSKNVAGFMAAAARFEVPSASLRGRLTTMALALESEGRWIESADALRLSDAPVPSRVRVLAKGGEWTEAVVQAATDTEQIRDLATSRTEQLLAEIESRKEAISKHATRLEVVRDIKEKRILNLKEGIECGRDLEDIDAFSEAGSTMSMLSRRTGKTGSSRASTTATMRKRKQIERKKQSLKEGGEYEDSALLLALHEQYKWINETSSEAKKLLPALVELDEFQLAGTLQSSMEKLCTAAASRLVHIWPTKLQPKHLCGPLQLIYTVNDTFAFPEDGGMPAVVTIEPEMHPPAVGDVSSWKMACL